MGAGSSSGAEPGGSGSASLFTVCLSSVLAENSLAPVEGVTPPLRCSTVRWVSAAALGAAAHRGWELEEKGSEVGLGPHPYSSQTGGAGLKQLIFRCENATSD